MALGRPNLNHFAINHVLRMFKDKQIDKNFTIETLYGYFHKVYYYRMRKRGDDSHLLEILDYCVDHYNPDYKKINYEGKSKISFVPYFKKFMHDRNLNKYKEHVRIVKTQGALILSPNIDTDLVPRGSRRSFAEILACECPILESVQTKEYDKVFIQFVLDQAKQFLNGTQFMTRVGKVFPTLISHYITGYSGKEISNLLKIDQPTLSRMKATIAMIIPNIMDRWHEVNHRQSCTCPTE